MLQDGRQREQWAARAFSHLIEHFSGDREVKSMYSTVHGQNMQVDMARKGKRANEVYNLMQALCQERIAPKVGHQSKQIMAN